MPITGQAGHGYFGRSYTETAVPHANGEYEKFGFPSQLHFPPVRDIVSPTQCSLHTAAGDTLTAALFLSSACMHKLYCATGFPKAIPHKERLATLHAICLQISRHISQKCS